MMMNPQTNQAFQPDDGNEYRTLAIKAVEPRKSAYKLRNLTLFCIYSLIVCQEATKGL